MANIRSSIFRRSELSTSEIESNKFSSKREHFFCICSYCEEVGVDQTNDVVAYLPRIFEGVLTTLSRIPQAAYIWPLESLAMLISVDENFVTTIEPRLTPIAIEMFVNFIQDPLINSETTA